MPQIDDLPPLREVIRRHGLDARKSLGQNFLLDLNLTTRIARAAGDLENITVIEVGPGPGGLTRALLARNPRKLIAIERDDRCLPALAEIGLRYPDRLEVVSGDALKTDMLQLAGAMPTRIVSNLPYNIGTALLTQWLTVEAWPPFFDRLVLTFQLEVAERIVARPGTSAYGRLAVLAGWRTDASIAFQIPAQAFVPAPKVTSAVVCLSPKLNPLECPVRALERVTAAAFGQRRKMLRQSLRSLGVETAQLLADAELDPTARAENLTVEQFVRLAQCWAATALPSRQEP